DGTGGMTPDATWFDDEATAGGGVPRRRERPAVADSAEPGHGRETADRPAGRAANRAGQGEAPTCRATSATSGGGSAHTDTGRAVAVGGPPGSGSLIGDALLRELLENGRPPRRTESSSDSVVSDTVVFEVDPRHDSTVAVSPVLPVRDPARAPTTAGGQVPRRGAPEPGPQAPASTTSSPTRRYNGHGRPPGPNGSHPPEGPAADHGADPGHLPDARPAEAGSPGPGASRRRPGAGRSATSDTDGLGLGDLLAGALAAYRDI
ncbi:MAG TPA: hypothetical protein VFY38_05805, partial [Pseudonocardia sp.]|nr:hypothetical protein [Pseudonocardia sp.]